MADIAARTSGPLPAIDSASWSGGSAAANAQPPPANMIRCNERPMIKRKVDLHFKCNMSNRRWFVR